MFEGYTSLKLTAGGLHSFWGPAYFQGLAVTGSRISFTFDGKIH